MSDLFLDFETYTSIIILCKYDHIIFRYLINKMSNTSISNTSINYIKK